MLPFTFINVCIFQIAWFSAAIIQDGSSWILFGLLGLHFYLSPHRHNDICVLSVILPLGVASELLLITTGLVTYHSGFSLPIWMVLLWCHLAVSINHSLQWLQKLPLIIQAMIAALAGALSYAAANRFEAVAFQHTLSLSLLLIAVLWAIQLPVMMKLSFHIKHGRRKCPV